MVNPSNPDGLGTGDYFFTREGVLNAGDSHVLTTEPNTMIIGYTTLTYTQFSGGVDYVGGTNINVSGQTISLTGTVAATNGGTGVNTVATGDLLYGSASNTWSKLGLGAAYKSLVVNASGTQVEWNAVPLNQSAAISGSLGPTNGGTGQTGYTVGDTLYSSATDTLTKLAGNTSTTKQYLSQTGTGSASQAPAWATLSAADIQTGTLGATLGGTGQSSYAVGDLLYADTTTSLAKLADVATGNVLLSGGVGAAPSYGKVALTSAVSGTLPVANGGTGSTTSTGSGAVVLASSPTLVTPALGVPTSGDFSSGTFTWPTFNQNTTGTAGNVSGVVAIANGGTGETTRQAAMDTLAGATTSGYYLRGNGTDVVMAAIQAGDVPTLNQNTTGTAGNVSGTVAIANGGTGQTTANAAFDALAPSQTSNSGKYLTTNGTTTSWATVSGGVTSITAGTYLTGGTITTSGTIAVDATTTNTASKVVARDASGNFAAGTITANLTGNVTGNVTGTVSGSAGSVANALTAGTGITFSSGSTYNGSAAITMSIPQAVGTASSVQFGSLGVGTAASGTTGEIRATNNVTAFYSSDAKFKENVKVIPNALDKVDAIGGVTFDWTEQYIKDKGGEDKYFVQRADFGVIAQDVESAFPLAVRKRDDGSLAVDYPKLVALAFAAIKELKAEVDELKKAK
jgi:hypothetical protein